MIGPALLFLLAVLALVWTVLVLGLVTGRYR